MFGRLRSLDHAALQRYFGNEETRRSAQLTLVAEVASAYLAVLADEAILKVTRETLESQAASYNLTKKSLDAGGARGRVRARRNAGRLRTSSPP